MNILVTAGNTQVPIDRVRCLTNIFTGATGVRIGLHCHSRGHDVRLLTSNPEVVDTLNSAHHDLTKRWRVVPYRTFDDLNNQLQNETVHHTPDVIIHSAAVSDFQFAAAYVPTNTTFDAKTEQWVGDIPPSLTNVSAGKIKSDAPELWLRMVRTPKLVDLLRSEWGFTGILVKFKLEADVSDTELLDIAERSRVQSSADLMVANTLDGAKTWANLGPMDGEYERIERKDLPEKLLTAIETRFGG